MRAAVTTASAEVTFWLMAIVAAAAVGLLIASAVHPTVKLPIEEWHCTASHTDQREVQTVNGPTVATIYACDQWSKR